MLLQHRRRNLRILLHEPKQRIARNLRAGGAKGHERLEARVRLAEDAVAVPGHHLPGPERAPQVIADVGVGVGGADVGLHFLDPAEDFLCGKTGGGGGLARGWMKGSGKDYPWSGPARPARPAE